MECVVLWFLQRIGGLDMRAPDTAENMFKRAERRAEFNVKYRPLGYTPTEIDTMFAFSEFRRYAQDEPASALELSSFGT